MKRQLQFNQAYIAFGANVPSCIGSPDETIMAAMQSLDCVDIQFIRSSSLWTSPAWPDPSEPEFTNAVALFMSHLSPLRFINKLLKCEVDFGRMRRLKNAPRTIDVDLISYGQEISSTTRVQLPHPRAHERAFVLLPLQEIAPKWHLPGTGLAVSELLAELNPNDRQQTKVAKAVK
ncbi:MAG: 2-amino-4-hydroxy-6-hydroxymethyldihydropteridine diphosphokinase [Robiginitomaculum sp.]|nr:2-amino-4-hydroxy-6-hydroxymethyldihydropteridine diphosphokinase [Robiginitomaculum sp.]